MYVFSGVIETLILTNCKDRSIFTIFNLRILVNFIRKEQAFQVSSTCSIYQRNLKLALI